MVAFIETVQWYVDTKFNFVESQIANSELNEFKKISKKLIVYLLNILKILCCSTEHIIFSNFSFVLVRNFSVYLFQDYHSLFFGLKLATGVTFTPYFFACILA